MPLPLIPLFGALLRSAGTAAASFGARAGAGAMLRSAGSSGIARGIASSFFNRGDDEQEPERRRMFRNPFRRRENPDPPESPSAFPASMHSSYRPPPPPPPGPLRTTLGLGLGATKAAIAMGLASKAATGFAQILNDRASNGLRVFNTQIAALAARKEVFQIRQNVRRGNRVAGTTSTLGDALMRNSKAYEPYQALGENLLNFGATIVTDISTWAEGILESVGIRAMVEGINDWLGSNKSNKGNKDLVDWLLKAKDGGFVDGNEMLNRRPDEHQGGRF